MQINPYGKPPQGLEPLASRECGEIAASLVVAIIGAALDGAVFQHKDHAPRFQFQHKLTASLAKAGKHDRCSETHRASTEQNNHTRIVHE
ncbi:MAG: hypothetical protein J0H65_03350 [Rhizobiales bacterium]|nr:hypothetical protein [Hyphomicrobiales bacterium]